MLTPNLFSLTKMNFGRSGDGRYILPVELIENSTSNTLLSFGICDDISFEEDFNKQFPKINIFCFDPSISKLPSENYKLNFYQLGLSGKTNKRKKLYTLNSILENCKISAESNFIVKMDIEGYEWDFLKKMDYLKFNIHILTMELHFLSIGTIKKFMLFPFYFYKRYINIRRLCEEYYVFYVHANNVHYCFLDKLAFPSLLEITFVKKSIFTTKIKEEIKTISSPNIINRRDIQFPFIN